MQSKKEIIIALLSIVALILIAGITAVTLILTSNKEKDTSQNKEMNTLYNDEQINR